MNYNNSTSTPLEFILKLIHYIKGDKVILIIWIFLICISLLAMSSSTPLLVIIKKTSRAAIIKEQFITIIAGIVLCLGVYWLMNIKILYFFAKWGFMASLAVLLILLFHVNLGPILHSSIINNSKRIIYILGWQINVFEFAKVAMIGYSAWVVNAFRNMDFSAAAYSGKRKQEVSTHKHYKLEPYMESLHRHFPFLSMQLLFKLLYLYIPVCIICILSIGGSMFSALFIGALCFGIALIGGIGLKEIIPVSIGLALLLGGCIAIHYASGGKYFSHISSAMNRFDLDYEGRLLKQIDSSGHKTKEFQAVLDKVKQPLSAKMAISEGKFLGKGPGKSTQAYIVPIIYEDYMYAFIVEEYGLWGGIIIMILYCSLLGRGSTLMNKCNYMFRDEKVRTKYSIFIQCLIGGFVLLISGQAFLHILINVGLCPLSGQTLPLISHGKFAFLMFNGVFGVLLNISKNISKTVNTEINYVNNPQNTE